MVAEATGIPYVRLNEIVKGKRRINAEYALRLAYFQTSPEPWLRLQMDCDLRRTERTAGERIRSEVHVLAVQPGQKEDRSPPSGCERCETRSDAVGNFRQTKADFPLTASTKSDSFVSSFLTVVVAQLVRALVCGTRGRGFKSRQPPQFSLKRNPARRSEGCVARQQPFGKRCRCPSNTECLKSIPTVRKAER